MQLNYCSQFIRQEWPSPASKTMDFFLPSKSHQYLGKNFPSHIGKIENENKSLHIIPFNSFHRESREKRPTDNDSAGVECILGNKTHHFIVSFIIINIEELLLL